MAARTGWRDLAKRWSSAPDGLPRPDAPLCRGPIAARILGRVIDTAAAVGGRIPAGAAHRLAVIGGNLEWLARPGKRRRLAVNIAHAVDLPSGAPAVRALVRREIVNEARRSADVLWAIHRPDEFLATAVIEGGEHAAAAAGRGRGLVLIGIHVGGWEVATAVPAAVVPVPTTAVAADDWLAWAIQHVRATAGLRIVYATDRMLEPARLLARGEALLVLGDDATRAASRSYPVRFCNATARLPGGAVALARLAGAPIVTFTVLPLGPRRWRITIDPALEPPGRDTGRAGERATLQLLADRWSDVVRRHPEHWSASFAIDWSGP